MSKNIPQSVVALTFAFSTISPSFKFIDFIHGVYRKPDMIVYDRYGNQHLLDYRSDPRFHYSNHPHHFNGHVWMNPSDRVVIPV